MILLRYFLEYSVIFLIVIFAVLPVRNDLKFSELKIYIFFGIILFIFVISSALTSYLYAIRPRKILIPGIIILFGLYVYAVKINFFGKLFCYCYALLLCAFGYFYTITLMASTELKNNLWILKGPLTLNSCLVNLGMTIFIGLIFFSTLNKKIPELIHFEHTRNIWKISFLMPLTMSLIMSWSTPKYPVVMLIGRVRIVTLVIIWFMPLMMLIFTHSMYEISKNLAKNLKLQQENTFLNIESHRYGELRKHIDEVRALRHDFRQHLLVINNFLDSNDIKKLREYLGQLTDISALKFKNYCANKAIDAIAAYYYDMAEKNNIEIDYKFNLPENLPINEADYCLILGNLLENALRAVKDLSAEQKFIKVISQVMSNSMLGIIVDNPFNGQIILNENGLPKSERKNGGIGLISISNTVKRYRGFMNLKTENNIFSVEIILYSSV